MTFGRPCMLPNFIARLDLPLNQSLEKLTMLRGSFSSTNTLDPPDTVYFFTATMYVSTTADSYLANHSHRQLYYILGDIISELYGDNVDIDPGLAIPTMLERTVVLEQKLAAWKHSLHSHLQRRPWDILDHDSVSRSTWDPVFDRLSVILTLRYLNTRIVLHRPILSAFLRQRGRSGSSYVSSSHEDPFFDDLGERSVRTCKQSAMDIIDIVYKTSKPPALLGAWWFTAYYSKHLSATLGMSADLCPSL